ncbi:Ig-like domain-containing protein [Treponema zuelzerae]|uniref:Ig-like domain-containing protein n=1 Tax=Teretinema zuelzerae TaxID=156 RepID=A0AAE3EHC0_9SPIR|nr:Ig-like domain-containing protein [Teretinema zuelzerae]MCD1654442.1 Ig-like domain-containing protein [Teretinema zuelzerae]MCD1656205.1 Ig-like domain-containing protein [Teretinema zuelzerae]
MRHSKPNAFLAFVVLISFLMVLISFLTASCSLFLSNDKDESVTVKSLAFSKTTLSLGIGGIEYLTLSINPTEAKSNARIEYTYDESVIKVDGDSSGATVSGLRNGNTVLIAKANGQAAACVIGVSGIDPITENAPYISTTMPVVEMEAGTTKKILVSLSKGSSAEMSQFSWSIDKSSIATVEASGQNGIISAKTNGVARITVSHPSSTYPLELLVFVKPENEKAIYLTTSQNIISLAHNGADRKVSVSLVNGDGADQNSFTWEVLDSEESAPGTISLTANGANAEISPRADGRATVRVSHPRALYPLDIKVRVVTIIENVYIDVIESKVTVNGSTPANLSVSLKGSTRVNELDPSQFQWTIDDSSICDFASYHNEVVLNGKKNGIAKLTVSHPAAKYPREIMIFVENQADGAVHSGAFITTSQNYIRTKLGLEESELLVSLVGGEAGDEKNFVWSVDNPDIISLRTTNGTTGVWGRTASIITQRANGTAFIEPKKEGSAVIYITHPKALTPTEVLVKVFPSYASFEEPLVIKGQSLLGLVRGTSQKLAVTLQGNVTINDESSLDWSSADSNIVTVAGAGKEQLVTAVGNGQTFITITNPRADNPKKILCYVAETAEELEAMQVLYSEKTYYNLIAGKSDQLYLMTRNLSPEELTAIQWSSSNSSVATVTPSDKNTVSTITGVSSGTAIITASLAGLQSVRFTVTVYPVGTDLSVLPPSIFFTTAQNVVQFPSINTDKVVSVTPVNLPLSDYSGISWISDSPSIVEVIPNGNTATITSKSKGTAVISISHPKADNVLKITVRIGDEYIIVNPKDPFISTSKDVVGLISGSQGEQITAKLENGADTTLFSWEIDDPSIAAISPLGNKCYIVPKVPGQARLIVRHANSTYDKNVLILVGNTQADIDGLSYLTTTQNVVRMVTGTQQTVSVRLSGTSETSAADYAWTSDNPSILQIVDNGGTAVLSGISAGVARVTVKHASCVYPLDITVIISNTLQDAASSPYITSSQNILSVTKGGSSKTLSVTLAGGSESDNQHFVWTVDRGDLIQLTSNGQSAVVKGISAGECRLTVTHPKSTYPFPLVVIVDEAAPSSNLYINPSLPIVSMKPADSAQTVTATLVGGTAEDKYGFVWSADNYNVIDLTYSANTAVITPRQEGKAEITISHPKSPYDGKIIVRVTEYSQFAFSQSSMTIAEGTTQFVAMQVPAIEGEYSGRVTYATDNSKIVTITGTNKVAQVTALATGTAIVTATSPSGAKSDLMIYVKKATEMTAPYITSQTNVLAMKITDSQRSVSASIVGEGISTPDQYNLQWKITDPSIASLIGTSGSNIIVKPLKAGETSIRISHPKTSTIYTIHVQVEGSNAGISLNKNYIATETGKTVEISANIDLGTSEDYKAITWSADKVGGAEIVSILGSGKTVALYALSTGKTTVTAEFKGKTAKCDVLIAASRQFSFDTQSMRLQPGQKKTFKYVLIPEDASINWMTNSNDFVTYAVDTSSKTVTVTGLSEGVTKLSGTANSMSASINITCAWDYKLSINKTLIKTEPKYDSSNPQLYIISYEVNPADARIDLLIDNDIATYTIDKTKREIYIRPTKEGTANFSVSATNVYNNYKFGTQTCSLNFGYSRLTVKPVIISKQGSYSRYNAEGGMLVLGDGEDVSVSLSVVEENASYSISNVQYVNATSSPTPIVLSQPSTGLWNVKHTVDYIIYERLVTHDTYFKKDNDRLTVRWEHAVYNGDNQYWYASFGNNLYFVRYKDDGGTHTGYNAYISPNLPNGNGNSSWTPITTWSPTFVRQERSTPLRMSESDYKANTDYYWPEHEQRYSYKSWGSWYDHHGTWSAWDINEAAKVPSLDKSIISTVTAGYINGTVVRPSGNQAFQIPIVVETRKCTK